MFHIDLSFCGARGCGSARRCCQIHARGFTFASRYSLFSAYVSSLSFGCQAAASLLSPFHVRSRAQTHKHTRVHAGNVCGVRGEDHGGEFPSVPTLPVAYLGYTEEPMK
jgi:hypothetical protein